jgi:delta 1-pyrroline-5-carboxylate dehydrogenase
MQSFYCRQKKFKQKDKNNFSKSCKNNAGNTKKKCEVNLKAHLKFENKLNLQPRGKIYCVNTKAKIMIQSQKN